jgi:hypothetical protein
MKEPTNSHTMAHTLGITLRCVQERLAAQGLAGTASLSVSHTLAAAPRRPAASRRHVRVATSTLGLFKFFPTLNVASKNTQNLQRWANVGAPTPTMRKSEK